MNENLYHQLPWARLRVWQVAQLIGCGKSKVWELTKEDPTFPKSSKISARVTVWDASEVRAWLDAQKGGQNNAS